MAAIITRSIVSLVSRLSADFEDITFLESNTFLWSPNQRIVSYDPHSEHAEQQLLHELAHAILNHSDYLQDIALIEIERDAWHYAQKTLSPRYMITINDEIAQSHLDSYRDWLHTRSQCPSCQSAGVQTDKLTYNCIACGQSWRANEARTCALRRFKQIR